MRLIGSVRIVVVVVALCLLCVALATWTLLQTREAALAEGTRRVDGVTLVLEQQADQMIAAVQQLLDLAAAGFADEAAGDAFPAPPAASDLAPFLIEGVRSLPQLGSVYFVDARGMRHALDAAGAGQQIDVSGSDFFRAHSTGRSLALRVVEPAAYHPEEARHLYLSRRLEMPDGGFAGVLLAELDVGYLRNLYGRIQLSPNSSIGLVTSEGRLVVRIPDDEPTLRKSLRGNLPRPDTRAGSGLIVSPLDGKARLLSYRFLADYPLIVFATVPRDELLADWRMSARLYGAFAALLLVALGMLSIQTVREFRQRRVAEQSVRDSLVDLRRQKELVEAILNALPDGTQLFDARRRMVGWNDRLFSILKVDRDDVFAAPDPTHRFFEILARRGEYGPGDVEDLIRGRLDITQTSERFTYRRQLTDGRWMECRGEPIAGLGLLAVYRDITAEVEHDARMRAIQSSLEEARYDAERANRAKSEFLAGMSHELRTPLNSILGFSEVIGSLYFGRDALDRYADYAQDINRSATHLLALIDSLLDLAKIEAGRMELAEETVAAADCVERAVGMCRPVAASKGVELTVAKVAPVALHVDRQKIVQSLLNVVSNAIKFTPSGGRVSVAARQGEHGLAFEIVDTGIGIAPDDIPKVFEVFQQVPSGLAMNAKGTGLGMPLTKHLVELHGGRVGIDSVPGEGTTVTLTIPSDRVREPAAA